jgi:L,D-transpeptidase catalytic domain
MLLQRRQVILALVTSPLVAWEARAVSGDLAAIRALKPGEFVWHPEVSPRGPTVVVVSLPHQLVHVYRNGVGIGVSTCSTGARGHETPTGVFTILQKRKEHYSSTYNNAPMPHMQRLTWRGIALHAGHLPGYPASHGCIRLPMKFSELLFSVTQHGTPVIIADDDTPHSSVVQAGQLLPPAIAVGADSAKRKAAASEKRRNELEAGITSILVSGRDRKAYLMTDGVMTFETPIDIVDDVKPLGTHLFSLIGPSADRHYLKWTAFGLGGDGQNGVPADLWSNAVLGRIEYLDRAAVYRVAETLRPGTVMVVTGFAAGPETRSGPDFTVIAEDNRVTGKRRAQ